MVDNKRKSRPNSGNKMERHKKSDGGERNSKKSTGPRLPAALRKELDSIRNPNLDDNISEDEDNIFVHDEEIDSDEGDVKNDLYEYEEEVAEEESKRNRRYDPFDNFEYQLPEKFQDEDVLSEDDADVDDGEDDDDSDNDERHARMLQDITGIPTEAFEASGKKKKRKTVVSEEYPESELNSSRHRLTGDNQITIEDLLDPLRGTSGYSKIRTKIKRTEEKGIKIQTPLPKPDRERVERATAYDQTKKDLFPWEAQIKRNREAATLIFDQRSDIKGSTVGAIASGFKPRTDLEKKIASLMHDDVIVDAYQNDGIKLLEMNKISVEDVKDQQDRIAKMRSLLYRHELKAKHIKKIKSKTFHRLMKKDKMKAASLDLQIDPEAARELAEKQERKRAEARMTLRHRNQGKWAKRALERGLDKQDDATRAAISEQLHLHNRLTRKMNSMKDSSGSDDSSEDDEDLDSSDEEDLSKLVAKAKEKTLKLAEEEDGVPGSGSLFKLSFMERALEKRKEAANAEAKSALEELELSLNQLDGNKEKGPKHGTLSGRRVFGATKKIDEDPKLRDRPEVDNYGSENEDITEENDIVDVGDVEGNHLHKDVDINLDVLREDLETGRESVFEPIHDITVDDPGPRTSFDVSVFASGSWRKMRSSEEQRDPTLEDSSNNNSDVAKPSVNNDAREVVDEDSDSDSGGQMVDGILSSGAKQNYELPSNEELLRRAFAGDDVEEEFQKTKDDVLNEENPEPEKPILLPGWGQWTNIQKKRGLPSWMSKEHADAKQKREEALKKRKDARLKHVIISEKIDKKAEKFHPKTLPYPFTSEEVYNRSNRMPLGPDFNPATVAGVLTRPEVIKKSGVIIPPISFKEVDPHERQENQKDKKHGGRRHMSNGKSSGKDSGKRPMDSKRTRAAH